ncbi:MAG: redoxin domain-containing protein [Salinivirgaceae bacterium]|nr:redoxin domain-containing protein [Salinivirgaceae bacterium]
MKKQLFAIGLALLIAGCARQPEYERKFTLNGETHLTLNFTNVDSPNSFLLGYLLSFPFIPHNYVFSVENDTTFEFTLPLNHPAEAILQCASNDSYIYIFLVQNEPLTINYDIANDTFSAEGFTKPICQYLMNHPTILFEGFDEDASCFAKIEKAYQLKQKALETAFATRQVPKWFYDYEKECLNVNEISMKFGYAQNLGLCDSLRKVIPMNNSKYEWLFEYSSGYLPFYHSNKYDTIIGPYTSDEDYCEYAQDNINHIKANLEENVVSYYVAARLSNYLNFLKGARSVSEYNEKNKYLNRLIEANSSLIKDTALLNYITSERQNIYNKLITESALKKGDKAPNFYLKNIDDKSVSLSDFAGKLVLLNFWDTHCSACIASIPKKNALVEKFGKQGFELVNICLDNAPDVWRQIINDHHPLGEELICKGQWEKNLRDKYLISGRPHFVLVDRNGLIIENHVKGDSLEVFIERNISTSM